MSKAKKSKRFVYQLESLLKVREIKKKKEQEKFQELEEIYLREKEKEATLKAQAEQGYTELLAIMRQKELPSMSIIELRKAFLEQLKVKIIEQEKVTQDAEKAKEDQREVLIKAILDKKIIEKDKEKTREAWRKLMDKEEMKFLDDIAGVRFIRAKRV